MSARNRRAVVREKSYQEEPPYTWVVLAVLMLMIGALGGYALSLPQRGAVAATTASPSAEAPHVHVVDERVLAGYRDILARDPKNVQAAISAGNMLYDARRYAEAVPFYQQAIAGDPKNVNVSTDLGTALWYSGRPDEALAQYAQSLAINPTHAQTLYNVGIVRSEGKSDYAAAADAWEKLLAANPSYENGASVRSMLADARARTRR